MAGAGNDLFEMIADSLPDQHGKQLLRSLVDLALKQSNFARVFQFTVNP